MKPQNIHDILAGAAAPQLQTAPTPLAPMIQQETYPDDFFDDGDVEETFDEQAEDSSFQENLAEGMSESYLDQLASEFRSEIDDDETDRKPWMDMISNVQEQIGIGEDSNYEEPFPGCSTVVFPLFVKAQIQFTSRAMPEIFPDDPVKGLVLGSETPELEAQSDRVADTMNYQYQYQDPENKEDFAKMLTWLPYTGSAFRYVSHDPIRNINIVRYVPGGDLIVPYATTSLRSAYRFSYRFSDSKNDIIKLQRAGFYRDVDLFDNVGKGAFGSDEDSQNAVETLRDASDGMTADSDSSTNGQNQTCYNVYTYRDLEGFEDTDESGEMTGIALPYVFTMHAATGKILAIRRNWKEDDEYRLQRVYFSHYQYHKGLGFYGFGLPHLLGSIQTAVTGALRAFGDSMAFSLLQGGFKLKGAKVSGDQIMKPGQYLDIDADIEDISKAIKPINFPTPSPIVIEYIQLLTKIAEEIISIGDLMTGDSSPQNSPVGSTLAMIEQANKVISAQHKSLYESLSNELQIMYDLNYDFLPEEDQFIIPGKAGVILRSDFDGKVGVLPTADPSVSSFQQRMAVDQAAMQLASIPEFKPFVKEGGYPLLMRMLKNIQFQNVESCFVSEQDAVQMIQQQQQNPPPNPELMKVQVMQQDSQVKAQTAQANAQQSQAQLQMDQQKMQMDAQKAQSDSQLAQMQMKVDAAQMQLDAMTKKTELQLQEKQMDMKNASDNKMIDARFLGSVAPNLMIASDSLATEQDSKVLSDDGGKSQAAPTPAPQLTPQQQALHNQVIAATQQHMQGMQANPNQPAPQMPVNPDKQNLLKRIMNKIRGQ